MADLKGKVGILTGGGSGIGKATALAMARAGAALVIGNRDAARGEEVVGLIRQAGGRAVFQKTDVSRPADVRGLAERAVKEFGRLDLAFNNAGVNGQQVPLHEQDIEKASFLFDVNIKGVFYSMKFEIEQMLKSGGSSTPNSRRYRLAWASILHPFLPRDAISGYADLYADAQRHRHGTLRNWIGLLHGQGGPCC